MNYREIMWFAQSDTASPRNRIQVFVIGPCPYPELTGCTLSLKEAGMNSKTNIYCFGNSSLMSLRFSTMGTKGILCPLFSQWLGIKYTLSKPFKELFVFRKGEAPQIS